MPFISVIVPVYNVEKWENILERMVSEEKLTRI